MCLAVGSVGLCNVPSPACGQGKEQACIPATAIGTGSCGLCQWQCQDAHHTDRSSLQERQRLETILNLCAEYTKTDSTEPGDVHRLLAGDADAGRQVPRRAVALGRAAEELRQRESLERSDEENLKEECSSTESTHHEVRGWLCHAVPHHAVLHHANLLSLQHEELAGPRAKEAQRLEEERANVLSCLDQLMGRVKELEQHLQETSREVRGCGALSPGQSWTWPGQPS